MEQDVAQLKAVLPEVHIRLPGALVRKHGAAGRRFADSVRPSRASASGGWAKVSIARSSHESLFFVEVRYTGSSQPEVRISWSRWHPKVQRKGYEKLERGGRFQRDNDYWWSFFDTMAPATWRADPHNALLEALANPIEEVVRSGVMGRLVVPA